MSDDSSLLDLTVDIVVSHVMNNSVSANDVAGMIKTVHAALKGLGAQIVEPELVQEPAVSIRASIKPDYLVCLEDGKKLKMLKRHLMTHYQMTPAQYREKWKLASDYPMVAPNYAQQRKELALKIGLGRKSVAPAPEPTPAAKATRKPRAAKKTEA